MYPQQPQTPAQNPLLQPQNRNYLIAGIGAAVAVIAFFLPFYSWSYTGAYAGTYGGSFSGFSIGGILLLVWLLSIAIAAGSFLIAYRPTNPFWLNTMPVPKQLQIATYVIAGTGIVGVLFSLITLLNIGSYGGIYSGAGYSAGPGFGLFLFLLAEAAVAAGGILQFLQDRKNPAFSNFQSPYGMPQQPPVNPYGGAPSNPSYPPTTGYPPAQPSQPPYGSSPSQTPYPPTQYPPANPGQSGQYPPQQPGQYPQQPGQYPQQQPPQYPQQ